MKKGFTLVELLAVIVILVILAVAAFVLVLPQVEKGRKKNFVSEVASIIDSAEIYFIGHPQAKSVSFEELKPYIKNYDTSKKGCVCPPKEGPNAHGYMIRYSNGTYKTYSDGFYEIDFLKTASGNPTDAIVKIDGNTNPDWSFNATNPACPSTCPTTPSQATPSNSNGGTNQNSETNTNPGTNSGSESANLEILQGCRAGFDFQKEVWAGSNKCIKQGKGKTSCTNSEFLYQNGYINEDSFDKFQTGCSCEYYINMNDKSRPVYALGCGGDDINLNKLQDIVNKAAYSCIGNGADVVSTSCNSVELLHNKGLIHDMTYKLYVTNSIKCSIKPSTKWQGSIEVKCGF